VLQHTPRWVTAAPPSDEIVPPLKAVVFVIAEVGLVERVAKKVSPPALLLSFEQPTAAISSNILLKKPTIILDFINSFLRIICIRQDKSKKV
jgi:hypothetical protein